MAEDNIEPCPHCNGERWMNVGEDKVRPCICLKRDMFHAFLGADISGAPKITKSPLYAIDVEHNKATLDRTTENVLINSAWYVVLPHLRLALGHHYLLRSTYRFTVITDERIINVFVGNEHYTSKSKKVRDDKDNYNGLKDLVEGPDLVIIRLGFLGYKNVAAAGSLKQALMLREAARKPTWLIRNPDADTPVSWNEEVAAYVKVNFEVVTLSNEGPSTMDVTEVEPAQPKVRETRVVRPPVVTTPTVSSDDEVLGEERPKPYKARTQSKKRYGSSGGGNEGGGGGDMPNL